jgi:hypothetical protein
VSATFAAAVAVPTLLVAAERDDITPVARHSGALNAAIGDATLVVLPTSGTSSTTRSRRGRGIRHRIVPRHRGVPMKIVFDCRYTRSSVTTASADTRPAWSPPSPKLTPVTMLISDERQLELLPDLPWIMGCDPTSLREPWVSRAVNRAAPDIVFSPMQMMGSPVVATADPHPARPHLLHATPPRRGTSPGRCALGWRVYHLTWLPVKLLLRGRMRW